MSDAPAVGWDRFSSDPRSRQNAGLRASDLDRNVALDAISAAYADGRLDQDEFEERTGTVQASKTLGELVAPLRDLAPDPGSGSVVRSSPSQLQARAEAHYVRMRQGALSGFLIPTMICWVIWLATYWGGAHVVPWPLFVTVGTAIRPIKVMVNKASILDSLVAKEERRERRRIQWGPR